MKKSFWLPIFLALGLYLVLPLPGLSAPLSERIEQKRAQIQQKKRQEGVLTTTISRFNDRIRGLQADINRTQKRLDQVQGALDEKREELLEVRDRLEQARDRLEQLRRELTTAREVLAERLVEIYKADAPDVLTVVLEADGFADLLERAEFLDRISEQDREITDRVRGLRDQAKEQARRLAELEEQAQDAAEAILAQRDEIATAKSQLVSSQAELRSVRNDRSAALARVRASRHELEDHLAALEAEQARVQAQLVSAGPQAFGPGQAQPVKPGSGQLIWPLNGAFTSPFGTRWGRLHAGIDIAVPEGTPIRAADAGRVVLAGWMGGYGNYTCVQHTDSMSTCYAHQSSIGVSTGQGVSQGQVIGYSGNTGNSTGPHLHFEVRIGGSPVDPMGYL